MRGFSLVELLVAMVVSGIIMLGVVAVFGNQTRATALQEDYAALEQNLRAAMDFIHRDARMAGAFSKDALAPFTIGAIDYDADGTADVDSDGGGPDDPDAIQLRFSPDPGLEIVIYNGAAANLRVCSPSGILDGQILLLSSNDDPPLTRSIEVTAVGDVSCPGQGCPDDDCDRLNFSPGPSALNSPGGLGGAYEDGRIWDKLETITYFQTDDADGNGTADDPALMRVRNLEAPAIVAFGITNLQVEYLLRDGTATTAPTFPNPPTDLTIERVRITLTGETRNAHAVAGGTPAKGSRTMTNEVQVRNLAL